MLTYDAVLAFKREQDRNELLRRIAEVSNDIFTEMVQLTTFVVDGGTYGVRILASSCHNDWAGRESAKTWFSGWLTDIIDDLVVCDRDEFVRWPIGR